MAQLYALVKNLRKGRGVGWGPFPFKKNFFSGEGKCAFSAESWLYSPSDTVAGNTTVYIVQCYMYATG